MFRIEKTDVYCCICAFCGYSWKSWKLPLRCASCKQPNWNKDQVGSPEGKVSKDKIIPEEPKPALPIPAQVSSLDHDPMCACIKCLIKKGKFK